MAWVVKGEEAGIIGACLTGCAFTTSIFILVACWVVKVIWKATFG